MTDSDRGTTRDWQPFLTTALENANDAIILYDVLEDGRSFSIVHVNRMFEEQTGYRRSEALGKAPDLMYGPLTDRQTVRELTVALHRRQNARGELLKYRKDGSTFWAEVNMRPLLGTGGHLAGVVAIQRDVTRRKMSEEQLSRTRAILDGIMRNTRNVIFAKDLDGRYLFVNDEFARIHGIDAREMLGRTDFDVFPADIARQLRDNDAAAIDAASAIAREEMVTSNGRELTYLSVKFPLVDERGTAYAVCGIATNITERVETMSRLRLLQLALDQANDAIAIFRLDESTDRWCVDYVNEMMLQMTGYSRDELIGRTSDILVGPETDVKNLERKRETLKSGQKSHVEMVAYRKGGEPFWVEFNASPLDAERQGRFAVVVYRDITQKKRREEQLSFEASHDAMTGAFNRRYLEKQLERAIVDAKERHSVHGLIVLDLDGFKTVNDEHGHAAGDKLLAALTILISSRLRRGDILARLGGDEFAVLLLGCSTEQSRHIAEDLLRAIDGYGYPWKGARLHVSASAGITPIEMNTASGRNALRLADEACYAAKRAGKNRVAVSNADGR